MIIENKIEQISEENAKKMILTSVENRDTFFVTLNMRYTQTWEQFAEALGNAFQLPMRNEGIDGTQDWMEDLDWLNKEAFTIILFNYSELLNKDFKNLLVEFFNRIIEWWEEGVTQFCVGGKAKPFNIYLVN